MKPGDVWGQEKTGSQSITRTSINPSTGVVNNRRIVIRFRLFDEGLGISLRIPEQNDLKYFTVTDEKTSLT